MHRPQQSQSLLLPIPLLALTISLLLRLLPLLLLPPHLLLHSPQQLLLLPPHLLLLLRILPLLTPFLPLLLPPVPQQPRIATLSCPPRLQPSPLYRNPAQVHSPSQLLLLLPHLPLAIYLLLLLRLLPQLTALLPTVTHTTLAATASHFAPPPLTQQAPVSSRTPLTLPTPTATAPPHLTTVTTRPATVHDCDQPTKLLFKKI